MSPWSSKKAGVVEPASRPRTLLSFNGRKRLVAVIVAMLLACAYPAFVLAFTLGHVARSDLPGGRYGPLDAYRHTLASAVVAFTLGPAAVEWVTCAMESAGGEENLMDQHNNRIGAIVGSQARSLSEIEPAVHAEVLRGAMNASNAMQVSWLPPERWRANWLW